MLGCSRKAGTRRLSREPRSSSVLSGKSAVGPDDGVGSGGPDLLSVSEETAGELGGGSSSSGESSSEGMPNSRSLGKSSQSELESDGV